MPHEILGLSFGEVVSIVTLLGVFATYFKNEVRKSAQDASLEDIQELKSNLKDLYYSVKELTKTTTKLDELIKDKNRESMKLNEKINEIEKLIVVHDERLKHLELLKGDEIINVKEVKEP